jgi:hypothetical protein
MAGKRVSMRKIREVLRLTHELGLRVRQASEATGVGKTAVGEYIARARVIGITWPIPDELSDAELERRLFVPAGFDDGPTRPVPDWGKVHEELKRRSVTLMILWEEHREAAERESKRLATRLATMTSQQGRDVLEIVDDRHGRTSTIVTSQLPVDAWHDVIPDPTVADAVLDRLVHTAHRFALKGESLRKPSAEERPEKAARRGRLDTNAAE